MSEGFFSGGGTSGTQTCALGKDSKGGCYNDVLLNMDSSGQITGDLINASKSSSGSNWKSLLSMAGDFLDEDEDEESTPTASAQTELIGANLAIPNQQATSFNYVPSLTGTLANTGRLRRVSQ